eukprot:4712626-Pyramimonas_sp.AAC.1
MGGGTTCGRCHWGLRWSSVWGHGACEWCTRMEVELHAGAATGAFGGAPLGTTKHARGAPKWRWNCMRALQQGPW